MRWVGSRTGSSDRAVCLAVRKLMDALKDEMDTQGCVARRCRLSDPGVGTDFLVRHATPEGNEHLMLCSTPLLTLGR